MSNDEFISNFVSEVINEKCMDCSKFWNGKATCLCQKVLGELPISSEYRNEWERQHQEVVALYAMPVA